MNTFVYTGKVQGQTVPNKNGDGSHFEGTIGDLPNQWLFGRAGEAAAENVGRNVLVTGIINSRQTDKGNHFISPVIFDVVPITNGARQNLVAFTGTITGVRRIKDGLYIADVTIKTQGYDKKKKKRVEVEQVIPVATGNVADSDIGKDVAVVGTIEVRNGKFIDIRAQSFTVAGSNPAGDEGDDLDDDLPF